MVVHDILTLNEIKLNTWNRCAYYWHIHVIPGTRTYSAAGKKKAAAACPRQITSVTVHVGLMSPVIQCAAQSQSDAKCQYLKRQM